MAKAPTDLRSLARAHTEMGVRVLAGIASNGENESARVRAVELLFERGWGKAPSVLAGDEDGGALQVIVRHIIEAAGQQQPVTIEHEPSERLQP